MNHSNVVSQLQEFQQASSGMECPRCHQREQVYLQLECGHQFCIICIIYIYLKYKNQLKSSSQIQCLNCHKISILDEPSIQLINQTIKKQIIPFVRKGEQHQSRINAVQFKQFNQKLLRKTIKSQDSSFVANQNVGNSKCNNFLSKCESPHSKIFQNTVYCKIHPSDSLQYVCMSCQMKLLCLRCIASKMHSSHDIKGLRKAYQILNQQINLLKINSTENIENAQLLLRRLADRSQLLKQRSTKQINQVKGSFQYLIKKLVEKQNQIVSSYQSCFMSIFQQMEIEIAKANEFLSCIKQYKLNIQTSEKSTPNTNQKLIEMISQNQNLKLYRSKLDSKDINSDILAKYQKILDPINFHHQSLTKAMSYIAENIASIDSQKIKQQFCKQIKITNFKRDLFSKNKTLGMRNCSSRDKLKKDQFKRIKTNIASLNSSRQKKQKKGTKTQEDQRRLKSKANYKTEANNSTKVRTNQPFPAYILKNIQKGKTINPFNIHAPSYMDSQFQQKNNSKILSKSNSNIVNQKKKKQIKEYKQQIAPQSGSIKERIQRKTIHNFNNYKTAKFVAESFKKKK